MIIAAVSDLFFASKIRATAEHLGVDIRFARSLNSLIETARQNVTKMILVDLQATNIDAIELATTFQSDEQLKSIPLVGFFSHVETELQERAKGAGYSLVMPRSAFSNRLAQLLSGEL
jgi:CheY-like chemotaxis protein